MIETLFIISSVGYHEKVIQSINLKGTMLLGLLDDNLQSTLGVAGLFGF